LCAVRSYRSLNAIVAQLKNCPYGVNTTTALKNNLFFSSIVILTPNGQFLSCATIAFSEWYVSPHDRVFKKKTARAWKVATFHCSAWESSKRILDKAMRTAKQYKSSCEPQSLRMARTVYYMHCQTDRKDNTTTLRKEQIRCILLYPAMFVLHCYNNLWQRNKSLLTLEEIWLGEGGGRGLIWLRTGKSGELLWLW
jgi:hypothetical protein